MKQFLLPEAPDQNGMIRLRDKACHYLTRVLRLKPGDTFNALLPEAAPGDAPGAGIHAAEAAGSGARSVTVLVRSTGGHTLTGEILPGESRTTPDSPAAFPVAGADFPAAFPAANSPPGNSPELPPLILFQALPKGSKMDLVVRQAAEGGISEVVPFVAERSVPEIREQRRREERWRRIVTEARQQSGSPIATRIRPVLSEAELFAYWEELRRSVRSDSCRSDSASGGGASGGPSTETDEAALGIVFQVPADPLAQGSFHQYLYRKPPLAVLAVGPEGGFSPAELDRFTGAGFKTLGMGPTVLRTETAALYGAAAVRIILMERSRWTLK